MGPRRSRGAISMMKAQLESDCGSHRRFPREGGTWWPVTSIANRVHKAFLQLRDGLTEEQRAVKARKEDRRAILSLRMKNAETSAHWADAAKELDILEGNEAWKYESSSSEFDIALIEKRLTELDEARTNCDTKRMLNLVRTALSRDLGGMGNVRLYKHSHIGTKNLIERYIDSTLETIRSLVETSKYAMPEGLETKDILEQVLYARQAFGRSALLFSGGATFGMNHIGGIESTLGVQSSATYHLGNVRWKYCLRSSMHPHRRGDSADPQGVSIWGSSCIRRARERGGDIG